MISPLIRTNIVNHLSKLLLETEEESIKERIDSLIPSLLKESSCSRSTLIQSEFLLKKYIATYSFQSEETKRAFKKALEITEGSLNEAVPAILENPEAFAFLTDKTYHIAEQIQSLWINWKNDCRVKEVNGEILFHNNEPVHNYMTEEKNAEFSIGVHEIKNLTGPLTSLSPSFQLHNHDGHYYFCAVTDTPTNFGDIDGHHSWLRLINADGEVISLGKFAQNFEFGESFRHHTAKFRSTDLHEHLKRPWNSRKETRFKITAEQYEEILQDLYSDIANEEHTVWSQMDKNCTDYVISKLVQHDLVTEPPRNLLKRSVWHFILPKKLQKGLDFLDAQCPDIIKKGTHLIGQIISRIDFVARLIILYLGGFTPIPENRSRMRDLASRIIGSFTKSYYITHPFYFREWLNQLENNHRPTAPEI